MASSVSEQEGVEAMLGLGLVAGAGGPADDPGEDEDDVPMIPGVMTIKGTQEDIVRRARACTGAARRLGRADRTRNLTPPHARTAKSWLAPGPRRSARSCSGPLAARVAGDAEAEDVSIRQQSGLAHQEVRLAHTERARGHTRPERGCGAAGRAEAQVVGVVGGSRRSSWQVVVVGGSSRWYPARTGPHPNLPHPPSHVPLQAQRTSPYPTPLTC